ncbi:uncharacterized protein BDW43DRAFT_289897 [Aspergillus alliaceus]|uniref:uncharacterized protein n=1 Tax=Petromyces alliaceus TaxID=209559 RepID=UPI0012A509FD|nr:uncharacterized protein BDW43DRAFT_289897 [Aspergillus alliaceus]KAB8228840.1 hypothetical protein BDW43DRAFT_289897 [Aspergillus alliaceus]
MVDDGLLGLGWLRVSHRELDIAKTTIDRPFHTHARRLPLRPNEIVLVDVDILPTSTLFHAGETLQGAFREMTASATRPRTLFNSMSVLSTKGSTSSAQRTIWKPTRFAYHSMICDSVAKEDWKGGRGGGRTVLCLVTSYSDMCMQILIILLI